MTLSKVNDRLKYDDKIVTVKNNKQNKKVFRNFTMKFSINYFSNVFYSENNTVCYKVEESSWDSSLTPKTFNYQNLKSNLLT